MVEDNTDMDIDFGNKTTLPDYQNVRNIILWQFQEFNESVVNLRISKNVEYRSYQRTVIKNYMRFFTQVNDTDKLSNITKKKREYLTKYYNTPILINKSISKNLLDISRELMAKYGIFNLEKSTEDYR